MYFHPVHQYIFSFKDKAARKIGRLIITYGLFQISQRIDRCAVLADLKMQMGTG